MYPPNAPSSKTAIVVSSGLQKAIVEAYQDSRQDLPYHMKMFYDLESAEEWAGEE